MKPKYMSLSVVLLLLALVVSACANNTATPTTETAAAPTAAAVEPTAVIGAPLGGAATAAPVATTAVPAVATTAAPAVTSAPTTAVAAVTSESATTAASVGPAGAAQTTAPAAGTPAPVVPATAGELLQTVRSRGQLICGFHGSFAGFGTVDANGAAVGFDVDFCKAVAAAIFGDASKVQYRPLTAAARFTAVQTREVDMLSRNSTWTVSRDTSVGMDFAPVTFYDGQGIMVRTADNITRLEDMAGASICVQSGTTTELNLTDAFRALNLEFEPVVFESQDAATAAYAEGRCDAVTSDKSQLATIRVGLPTPADNVVLDVTISKEPLAPAVLQGDPQWRDIVAWSVYGVIAAEELGINQANVDSFADSTNPSIRRLLGIEGDLGKGLGLENDFMVDVIKAVGNYGEIYNRHLGPDTPFNLPRGQNALYTQGGLMYAPPFR